jgi:predicted ATPase
MREALSRHDEIIGQAISANEGHVVKMTGDGFHAAFSTAADAVRAAIDAQSALCAEPWGITGPLAVRIGMHTGEAEQRAGDYFGSAVNRAARVMAVAHGGQILCSRVTAELAGSAVGVRSLGSHRLRDLGAPEELYQVGEGEFPPLPSVDTVPTNLPTMRTELIGRIDDVEALSDLVRREHLVTLTGVGGVGKTRLAIAVAAAVGAEFSDGCWFVELAPVASDDDVTNALASSVRSPTTGLDALAAYLADRRVLVLLDNCEHLLDAAAEIVDVVLASGPDVHVLVTSREPLGLDGEQVRRVRSLDVPDPTASGDQIHDSAAVRLFAERASAAADGFSIDAGNATSVAEICRHLDGIPLAIELAAARVRSMSPTEIAGRLDERFRLLGAGSRRTQERHRTLFAAVSWSHDLLSDDEKSTFRRLAVFPASFDLAAAEAVAGTDDGGVTEFISRLVDRSLVVYEPSSGRYRLLETLRQFAADRLAEADEIDATRARHADHFVACAARWGALLDSPAYDEAAEAVSLDLENVRACADWCVEVGHWQALVDLCRQLWYYMTQSAPADGVNWFHQFLAHADDLDDQAVVDALGELAFLEIYNFADFDAGALLSRWSRELANAKQLLESPAAGVALGLKAAFRGDFEAASRLAERALVVAEARGDEKMAISALMFAPQTLALIGESERAVAVADDALRRAKRFGHPTMISAAVTVVAGLYTWAIAEPDYATSLAILEREDAGHAGGEAGAQWANLIRGYARLGLDLPGAAEDFAIVARAADRLAAPHILDRALRGLAVVAAESGHLADAWALIAYTEEHLRDHRTIEFGQDMVQERLDRALGSVEHLGPVPRLHRRDVMALVDSVEAGLRA